MKLFQLLEGYFDVNRDASHTLFHATPLANMPKIKQEGLKPSQATSAPHSQPLVWLADDLTIALKHVQTRQIKKGIAIVKIEVPPGEKRLHKAMQSNVWTFKGILPKEYIKDFSVID